MARDFKVFVSHAWDYTNDLINLQKLLNERGYFNVEFSEASKNVPINSANAGYVKTVLKKRILESNIVLALAGVYASHSDWMIWEIDTAYDNDIPIIGVILRGQTNISNEVNKRSKENVRWNTESIVAAIRKWAKS